MKEALKEAKKAYAIEEIPVGCVIVKDGKVIARGYNKRESLQDVTLHAEIMAIKKACKKLGSWRLEDCDMYVTLEPCPMCSGAIIQSRIKNLYIGAYDPKTGAAGSVLDLFSYTFNHKVNVYKEIMIEDCSKIIKDFFKELRKKSK
jgi:tRNA(adenine34) deaminase